MKYSCTGVAVVGCCSWWAVAAWDTGSGTAAAKSSVLPCRGRAARAQGCGAAVFWAAVGGVLRDIGEAEAWGGVVGGPFAVGPLQLLSGGEGVPNNLRIRSCLVR